MGFNISYRNSPPSYLLQNVLGYSSSFIHVPLGSIFHFGKNILLKILNYTKISKLVKEEFIRIFFIGI